MVADQRTILEAEIGRVGDLGLDELRRLWGCLLGVVPDSHSTSLLRRRLAYELQARVHGDLPRQSQRRLRNLHKSFKADPAYSPMPSMGLTPGTVLTRTWQGAIYRVHVTGEGFDYLGEHFGSLSEVARRITGTKWSGPVFFGLKRKAKT